MGWRHACVVCLHPNSIAIVLECQAWRVKKTLSCLYSTHLTWWRDNCSHFILLCISVNPESIRNTGCEAGMHHTHTHIKRQFKDAIQPTGIFVGSERNSDNLEETNTETRKTSNLTQRVTQAPDWTSDPGAVSQQHYNATQSYYYNS